MIEILEEYDVKNKCYIAGGCITSIINRERINDINIFFRDNEACDEFENYIKEKKLEDFIKWKEFHFDKK